MGVSQRINGAFYKTFYNWGHFIGRCPFLVMVISGLLGILGGARLAAAPAFPIESVVEQEELWVPQKAQAVSDKARYDDIFTTTFRRNTIYFTTKPRGGNVLTSSVLSEIRRFDLMVTTSLNATAHVEGRTTTPLIDANGHPAVEYNDVCARSTIPIGRNLSDPDDEGGIPCILFGHPLEGARKSSSTRSHHTFPTPARMPARDVGGTHARFADGTAGRAVFPAFYRVGGGTPRDPLWLPGDFNFDFTDAEINAILTAGRGPDKTLFPDNFNRTINVEASYGGITRDASGAITGATAVAMTYLLDQQPVGSAARMAADAWEDQLNILIGESPNGGSWTYPDLSEGYASFAQPL